MPLRTYQYSIMALPISKRTMKGVMAFFIMVPARPYLAFKIRNY